MASRSKRLQDCLSLRKDEGHVRGIDLAAWVGSQAGRRTGPAWLGQPSQLTKTRRPVAVPRLHGAQLLSHEATAA